ncbi:MBL fold metallo-hydrolase, partial [Paucibacter sp. XJ19-41]|uniref:MBL fold metallo-hydrolase n=1 Tax=Paucibacter sp. XJ19-41 TaxID=2927824 RepID=UPI002349879C
GGALIHPAGTNPLPVPPGARARPAPLWEPQLLGDFTATAVPASDGFGDPQVSWVVSAGGRRIFHGGDTLWHGHWWRIGRQLGPFDAAFLPINGARFGWRQPISGQPGVLTPEQAVAAATVLGARRLIPIHYGVSGMAEYVEVEDPLARLRAAAREKPVAIQALTPGEWLDWAA